MNQFEVRARLKVREGKLEEFKRQAAEVMRQALEKDTGTLAYDWFLSTDGTECEVREAYVNADALVDHAFHIREARDTCLPSPRTTTGSPSTASPRLGSWSW